MNTSIALAGIASKTVIILAAIGAFVRVAPPVLERLGISNTRPRQPSPGQDAAGQQAGGSAEQKGPGAA